MCWKEITRAGSRWSIFVVIITVLACHLGNISYFLKHAINKKLVIKHKKNIFSHIAGEIPKNIASCPIPNPSRDSGCHVIKEKEEYKPNEVTILLKHSVGSRHAPLSVCIMTEAIINIVAAHLLFCHRVSVNTWPWSQHYQAVPQHSVQYYM